MIRLVARVYTQTNCQTNYLFIAQVRPDGSSISSINRANIICSRLKTSRYVYTVRNGYCSYRVSVTAVGVTCDKEVCLSQLIFRINVVSVGSEVKSVQRYIFFHYMKQSKQNSIFRAKVRRSD